MPPDETDPIPSGDPTVMAGGELITHRDNNVTHWDIYSTSPHTHLWNAKCPPDVSAVQHKLSLGLLFFKVAKTYQRKASTCTCDRLFSYILASMPDFCYRTDNPESGEANPRFTAARVADMGSMFDTQIIVDDGRGVEEGIGCVFDNGHSIKVVGELPMP